MRVDTRAVSLFLAVAFAGAALLGLVAFGARAAAGPLAALPVTVAYMFTPLLAAVVVQRHRRAPLGPAIGWSLHPNRWWLAAWTLPVGLALATLGVELLLPGVSWSPTSEGMIARYRDQLTAEQLSELRATMESFPPLVMAAIAVAQGLAAGATVNALAAFGEEAGWRGFLHRELAPLGFWRSSLLIGGIWGLWHAPLIVQGHNYPEHPALGVVLMLVFCTLLAPPMAWARERSGSVVAAALFHGTLNGVAGLPLLWITGGDDRTIGLTGASGLVVLAVANVGIFACSRHWWPTIAAIRGIEDDVGHSTRPRV